MQTTKIVVVTDQHRVTTAPIKVTDWKGEYTLRAGERFTVLGLAPGSDTVVDIERDGLLSGSMGGSMDLADMLSKTEVA